MPLPPEKKKNNKKVEITYVDVPAGGVAFHHGLTWHGSGTNSSKVHRRSIVSHCVPHDARFHPNNTGGTAKIYKKYKKNNSDELDDIFFPLLWKEKLMVPQGGIEPPTPSLPMTCSTTEPLRH